MAGQLGEEPWGAARVAYAYLAALMAALAASLIGVIARPIIDASGACSADASAYCLPATIGLVVAVGLAAGLVLAGWIVRLGWQWAAWLVALSAAVGQITIEADNLLWLVAGLALPGLAALIMWRRPDRQPGRPLRLARLIGLGLVAAQFVIWLVVLLAGA